jgi:catechol 2,3-dioxygenase
MTKINAPQTTVGEVQLYVADLQRSLAFYQNRLGFKLLGQEDGQAHLGAGTRRLITLIEKPNARHVPGTTGLYHFAVLMPSRRDLAHLLYTMAEQETEVQGAADHGVSEALYLADPDGNGIELYSDRHKNEWPRDDLGRLQMGSEELDIEDLVLELRGGLTPWQGLPEGTTIGHIHLQVSDLAETERFYRQVLGFEMTQRYGSGALFFSAGGYHHHVGANTWTSAGAPPPPPDAAGLRWFSLILPNQEVLEATLKRLQDAGVDYETLPEGYLVRDPSQNSILFRAG